MTSSGVSLDAISLKIIYGKYFDQGHSPVWIIKLAVGNLAREVNGRAFMDRNCIELRFVTQPEKMEIPGFLSGQYLSQGVSDSTLRCLFEQPCAESIQWLEARIREFLECCRFSMHRVTSVKSGVCRQEAIAYRMKGLTIPIRRV